MLNIMIAQDTMPTGSDAVLDTSFMARVAAGVGTGDAVVRTA